VAPIDLNQALLTELCAQSGPELVPVIAAAAAILQESAKPRVYLGGEQYLLDWPQLDGKVKTVLATLNDEEAAARLITPATGRTTVLLGEDMNPSVPGMCIVSKRYLVGGGLSGTIALVGPTRMPFSKLIPLLEDFAAELGEGMSGRQKETPQAAPARRYRYEEELE
jgi:heat-inducible transcriptional repressor